MSTFKTCDVENRNIVLEGISQTFKMHLFQLNKTDAKFKIHTLIKLSKLLKILTRIFLRYIEIYVLLNINCDKSLSFWKTQH